MGLSPPFRSQQLPPPEPLNPSNLPQPTRVEPSNCMERIVQWLSSDETSLLLKIGAVALAVIATVGVGILVGYPLLISAIVLIPTTIWAVVSGVLLARREIQAANAATHAANSAPLGTLTPEQELLRNAIREAPRQALRKYAKRLSAEKVHLIGFPSWTLRISAIIQVPLISITLTTEIEIQSALPCCIQMI